MNATTSKSSTKRVSSKKTATPKKAPQKKAAPRKSSNSAKAINSAKATNSPVQISAEERWRMIAVAAYHKAERRGFSGGHEVDDWLQAEREINAILHPG